jgi:hypothetical protein
MASYVHHMYITYTSYDDTYNKTCLLKDSTQVNILCIDRVCLVLCLRYMYVRYLANMPHKIKL